MKKYAVSLMIIGSLMLGGCGDESMEETATIEIGGTVNGLDEIPGRFVEISLVASDGTETEKVYSNGAFAFDDTLVEGETYAVSISENPEEQVCTVAEGGAGEATGVNITNIVINCI